MSWVLTWEEIDHAVVQLQRQLKGKHFDYVVGIKRGGVIPASLIHRYFPKSKLTLIEPDQRLFGDKTFLVVDDIFDTGNTLRQIKVNAANPSNITICALTTKQPNYPCLYGADLSNFGWITFPWEVHDND